MPAVRSAERNNAPLIAVLGAAGLSGRHLLSALTTADVRVRAVVHSEAGAVRARETGAFEVVRGEFSEPHTIQAALEGADGVYMIPPSLHPEEDVFARNAVRAAQACGAKRFVYASVLHPHTPALHHHMRKARAEDELRSSSLQWTILQPAMYAQMVFMMFGAAPAGRAPVPFNTELIFSVIDLRDLSEVAVKVLTEEGHGYAGYELCGSQHTMADMVRIAGRARGVALEPVRIAPSEAPLPPRLAEQPAQAAAMRAMWEDYDRHGLRGNTNVLRTLLGRAPATFEDVARSMAGRSD